MHIAHPFIVTTMSSVVVGIGNCLVLVSYAYLQSPFTTLPCLHGTQYANSHPGLVLPIVKSISLVCAEDLKRIYFITVDIYRLSHEFFLT